MNDVLLDTAVAAHRLLDALPAGKRTAAAMLLDLPADYPVCDVAGDCPEYCDDDECDHDRPTVGQVTAGQLLRELRDGKSSPALVWQILLGTGNARPGIAGVS
jgi:hypothetical protein